MKIPSAINKNELIKNFLYMIGLHQDAPTVENIVLCWKPISKFNYTIYIKSETNWWSCKTESFSLAATPITYYLREYPFNFVDLHTSYQMETTKSLFSLLEDFYANLYLLFKR